VTIRTWITRQEFISKHPVLAMIASIEWIVLIVMFVTHLLLRFIYRLFWANIT